MSFKTDKYTIIRQAISDTLTLLVGLRERITQTLTNKFDIRSIVIALPSFTSTSFTSDSFTLTAGTKPQLTLVFDIKSVLAGKLLTVRFDIRQAITETLTNKFNLRQAIVPTLTNRFDIREEISVKTLTAKFIIRQAVSDTLTVLVGLRERITKTGRRKKEKWI